MDRERCVLVTMAIGKACRPRARLPAQPDAVRSVEHHDGSYYGRKGEGREAMLSSAESY